MIKKVKRLLRFIGIWLPDESSPELRLTRRLAVLIVTASVFFALGGSGFFYFSSKSGFCRVCHVMRPYYDSWKASSHGKKGVECITCHFAPGFHNAIKGKVMALSQLVGYMLGTYPTKFRAEIPDESCLRPGCHETRLLDGKVKYKGKIKFDHKPHMGNLRRGKKLRCQTCHSQIVQGTHVSVTESVCFTCHFKGLRDEHMVTPAGGCTGCHDVPTETLKLEGGNEFNHAEFVERKVECISCHFDLVQGTGEVPRQVCIGCHSEQDRLARYDDADFLHREHVTNHNVECFYCHSEIRHGKGVGKSAEVSCNRCHAGKHNRAHAIFHGTGGRGVPDHPSHGAAAGVQCAACHKLKGHADGAGGEEGSYGVDESVCVKCHGDAIEGALAALKSAARERVAATGSLIQEANDAVKLCPAPRQAQAREMMEDALYNYKLVVDGNAAHNLEYAEALLNVTDEGLRKVIELTRAE